MKILLFGASGMVGQGALRACLRDARVERVASVVRRATGIADARCEEIVLPDLFAFGRMAQRFAGFDACLFCAGVSAVGLDEAAYARLTYAMTMAVAAPLTQRDPPMTFVYVSGAGTDQTGKSRFMWARVKGRTEKALLTLPFKAAFMLRPGPIQPMHGIRSKTGWYRALYAATAPLTPLLLRLFPDAITTTEALGRAMVALAAEGYGKPVLATADINRLGSTGSP